MSSVKRWDVFGTELGLSETGFTQQEDGEFVKFKDYEELEKENTNKDLLLKQKTERINELEKENAELKDTNFMVENFHKVCEENEELKEENSFKYVNKLSENNRQLEKENGEILNFMSNVFWDNSEEMFCFEIPHSTKHLWAHELEELFKKVKEQEK